MNVMHIPDAIIELLEAHLEPKETAKAIQAIGELLAGIGDRQRERELRFVEDLKAWLSTELATKSELAGLEVRLKEEIARVRERMATLEGRLEATATKEDLVREVAGLNRKFTVLWLVTLFSIVFLNQNALEFIARLLGLVK